MCSNYQPVTSEQRLLTFFGAERAPELDPTPAEVWPLGLAPFIRLHQDGSGNRIIENAVFGMVAPFAKEIAYGKKTYNARSETVDKLVTYKGPWAAGQRCIIPAEAIFEPCYESGKAVRWSIRQAGGVPMGIAGIYRPWKAPDGRWLWTMSMLTVNAEAHPVFKRMHRPEDEKRMVIILDPSEYDDWLTCSVEKACSYFRQWQGELEAFPAALPPRIAKPRAAKVPEPRPDSDDLF
jgi:putative SOS response-associated peptidase YedK